MRRLLALAMTPALPPGEEPGARTTLEHVFVAPDTRGRASIVVTAR